MRERGTYHGTVTASRASPSLSPPASPLHRYRFLGADQGEPA